MRHAVIITTYNHRGSHTYHVEFENGGAARDAVASLHALYQSTNEVNALITAVPLGLPHEPFSVQQKSAVGRRR